MCRNIKTLFNFDPPASSEEIESAARQYVRKLSGYNKPSQVNEVVFESAVSEITKLSLDLLERLKTNAQPKNRALEQEKSRLRHMKRFG